MTLATLLPHLKELPIADKYQLLQALVSEIARVDGIAPVRSDFVYRVESQFDALEAAKTLQRLLETGAPKP